MDFISLFTGIGGLDLGLERAGMNCVAQVEIDEFCQKVLTKHWPNVPKFKDVINANKKNLPTANLICGGFPCQDVSIVGKRKGLKGKRSTLWTEFHRIVCEVRPEWVVIENVRGLLSSDNGQFFTKILRDLAASGYDAEWRLISASDMGAPHLRERIIIIAYPYGKFGSFGVFDRYSEEIATRNKGTEKWGKDWSILEMASEPVGILRQRQAEFSTSPLVRMVDGIPDVLDRLRATGNAVVPQLAEIVGHCILHTS